LQSKRIQIDPGGADATKNITATPINLLNGMATALKVRMLEIFRRIVERSLYLVSGSGPPRPTPAFVTS
jgi:hypothetical protein